MIEVTGTLVMMLCFLVGAVLFIGIMVWFINWLRKFMHYSGEKLFKPFNQAMEDEWKKRKGSK